MKISLLLQSNCLLLLQLISLFFLVTIISAKDNLGLMQPINEASFGILGSVKASLVDALLQVIERFQWSYQIAIPVYYWMCLTYWKHCGKGLLNMQIFWNGWKTLKSSENYFCNSISLIARMKAPLHENLTKMEALSLAYKYQCQTAVLEIMAEDLFL